MPEGLSLIKNTRYSLNTQLAFILGLVAFIIYANTFSNGYVLDDFPAIVKNDLVANGWSAIPEIFSTPYLRGFTTNTNDLYRPLPLAMFAIEYQLSGGSPVIGHVMNVVVFAGCVILLFLFLDALFKNRKTQVAFIAALLFALHPIHTEVVANIKSRDELLCFFFSFLSLALYIRYMDKGRVSVFIAASVSFFLSLLSKETSITFLIIVPVVFFFFRNENKNRATYITGSTIAAAIIFLLIRSSVITANSTPAFHDNVLTQAPDLLTRLSTAIFILAKYLKLLLLPYPLSCDYSYNTIPFVSFDNPAVWITLAMYLFLIITVVYRLIRYPKDPLAFAILFFIVTISLFSNIFFLIGAAMAERFLFFPSVGFCLALAIIVHKWSATIAPVQPVFLNRKVLVVLLPLSLVYAAITFGRNNDWKDGLTLYKNDIRHQPNSYRLAFYLGSELLTSSEVETDAAVKNKLIDKGINYYKRSVTIYPAFTTPYAEIGYAYANLLEYDSAIRYDLLAIELNPRDTFTVTNLAALYFKKGMYRESLELCKRNLVIDAGYTRAYRNMGSCYLKLGVYDSAIIVLKKAIELQPGASASYYYLSVAYQQSGMSDSAAKYEAIARQNNF